MRSERSDGALPDHGHGVAGLDVGTLRAHERGREDVGEEHRLFGGDRVGDGVQGEVGGRNRGELRLAAVEADAGAEHLETGSAEDRVARAATVTVAARGDSRHEHAVADLRSADVGSRGDNLPDELVTEPGPARHRRVPLVVVEVGTADRGALDPDDHPVEPGSLGVGDLLDRNVMLGVEHHCSQRVPPR